MHLTALSVRRLSSSHSCHFVSYVPAFLVRMFSAQLTVNELYLFARAVLFVAMQVQT